MNHLYVKICLFFLLQFSFFQAYSSHYSGASLRYEQLSGGCTYRIYLTQYYDCSGAATVVLPPPPLNLTLGATPFPTGCAAPAVPSNSWVNVVNQDISPICPTAFTACTQAGGNINGYMEMTYYTDYNLCGVTCDSILIGYGSCCRTYALNSGAGGQGMFAHCTIPLGTFPNNSSPSFNSRPNIYWLYGSPTAIINHYDASASDLDGDSLVYSLAPCYDSYNVPVTYNAGYSPTSPLGPNINVSINSHTGLLTLSTVSAPILSGLLGIKVDEYRNGVKIGATWRDMTIMSVPGTVNNNPQQGIMNISCGQLVGIDTMELLCNQNLAFDIQISDPDISQSMAYTSNISQKLLGTVVTSVTGTNPLTLHVNWTPDWSAIGNQRYFNFVVRANDGFCPLYAPNDKIYTIKLANSTANISSATCLTATGAIDVFVSAGTAPYTYTWNTGQTTEDLTNIPAGNYHLHFTDALGTVYSSPVFHVPANSGTLQANLLTTLNPCGTYTGDIAANTIGGTTPYSYTWNNGTTFSSIIGVPVNTGYSVDITDAVGCFLHLVTMLTDTVCRVKIGGKVYDDRNADCGLDATDFPLVGCHINISGGSPYQNYSLYTDANGEYEILADTGTYTIQANPLPTYYTATCPVGTSKTLQMNQFGADSLQNHFSLHTVPNLSVDLIEWGYIPGFSRYATIVVHADSISNFATTLVYHYDPNFVINTITPTFSIYSLSIDTLTHTITMNVGGAGSIYIDGTTNINAILGTSTYSDVNLNPISGEINLLDNNDMSTSMVVGSYDPNYIEVSPQGQTNYGLISPSTQDLTYTIHFQNTGNWQAEFVVLRDTIDSHLDRNSFQHLAASHNYQLKVEQDSIFVFTFAHIQLPDSFTNEPESHGFVKFKLALQPNLPLFTEIRNQASIYFDFNVPVITNEVLNTLYNFPSLTMGDNFKLCQGDSVTALLQNGKPPYTFSWSSGQVQTGNTTGQSSVPFNISSGNYQIVITDAYNISLTHPFFVTILPPADANFTYAFITPDSLVFSPNNTAMQSYSWTCSNGSSSNQPIFSLGAWQAGTYQIDLAVTDSCGFSTTESQTITLSSILAQSLFNNTVKLAPNPFSSITNISFHNPEQEAYQLTISDLSGKILKVYPTIRANSVEIDSENWAQGMYIWELKGKYVARGQMMKE